MESTSLLVSFVRYLVYSSVTKRFLTKYIFSLVCLQIQPLQFSSLGLKRLTKQIVLSIELLI